jgi:glycosyltransferase involved in cell wall biosynthesis
MMPVLYGKMTHFINPSDCKITSEQYRIPFLYNLRKMRFRYNPLRNLVIKYILKRYTNERLCGSDAHRQALEANGLAPFRVIPLGIDVDSFKVSPNSIDALRQQFDLVGRKTIYFGGRITELKGIRQLIAALQLLVIQIPNVLLVIAARSNVQHYFDQPEYKSFFENNVRFLGWLSGDDLRAIYHAVDVVTLPSICFETAGLTLMEGMTAGRPTIATCYGGPAEIVVDSETGFTVNPFNAVEFADRLEKILSNPDLAQRMGQAGKRRIHDLFTQQQQIENMLKVFQNVISDSTT